MALSRYLAILILVSMVSGTLIGVYDVSGRLRDMFLKELRGFRRVKGYTEPSTGPSGKESRSVRSRMAQFPELKASIDHFALSDSYRTSPHDVA